MMSWDLLNAMQHSGTDEKTWLTDFLVSMNICAYVCVRALLWGAVSLLTVLKCIEEAGFHLKMDSKMVHTKMFL